MPMNTPHYLQTEPPAIGDGKAVEIAEGVLWLRMPVGGRLQAINVWALADGDGWTIVDTGWKTPETQAAWQEAMQHELRGLPVRRIIVTHMHPDHSGMAGWLAREQGAPLCMTRLEYLTLRAIVSYMPGEPPAEAVAFYRSAGWDDAAVQYYSKRFGTFGIAVSAVPDSFVALEDGQIIPIGERKWEIVVGKGHSPEHAMLYCRKSDLLISGDQVLPEISSNVSVQPLEPEADPLDDWLTSLAAIRERVADTTLVLPAHGQPFHGLHDRVEAVETGHAVALERLLALLDEPKRAIDVFGALFKRPISQSTLILATGESLAHLALLTGRGQARRERDASGVYWWRAR
ncbi:Glyoxylase, beta-lactamase superfamily II [Sphingobium faniae]|nr:Glyoxylase, beta-lactamase superfamily II [Sphingobium faniae]